MSDRPGQTLAKPPPGRYSEMRRDLLNYLFWLFARTPNWVSRAHITALCTLARAGRRIPGNPVRESLASVARLAEASGHHQEPVANYREFVEQIRQAGSSYLEVLREGPPAVDRRVDIPPDFAEAIWEQLAEGRGMVAAVPHNSGGILASVGFARAFPTRVLLRNSTSERRDQMMLEFFRRLEVDAYLTRSASPAGMFRASLGALRAGKVLVLTLDNIDPGRKSRVDVSMFNCSVPFASWGARIALQAKAPLVPFWVAGEAGRFRLEMGQPIRGATLEQTIQHYATFFERMIVEHPADWLFLGHKRWNRFLRKAADSTAQSSVVLPFM